MSLLHLKELSTLLKLWENVNLYASFIQRSIEVRESGKLKNISMQYSIQKGSELERQGYLAQPIKDYQRFRQSIEKGNRNIPHELYIPNVPLRIRDRFTKIDMLSVAFMKSLLTTPFYIAEWLKYKSVVSLSPDVNLQEVPIVSSETNYLSYLPYETFLLILPEPITLKSVKYDFVFSKCICISQSTDDPNNARIIRLFCIRENPEELQFAEQQSKKIEEFLGYKKGRFSQMAEIQTPLIQSIQSTFNAIYNKSCMDFSFVASSGSLVTLDANDKTLDLINTLDLPDDMPEVIKKTFENVPKKMLFHLNALGKVFYETTFGQINPAELKEMMNQEDLNVSLDQSANQDTHNSSGADSSIEQVQWNEVSGEHVCHIKTKKINGTQVAIMVHGSQKSPHVRRGHVREYEKDGVITMRKWIKPIVVRKDRLEKTLMTGTSLVVKK